MGKLSAFLWSYKKVFPSQKDEKEKKTKRIFNWEKHSFHVMEATESFKNINKVMYVSNSKLPL